ncbi:MAG: glycosyltransferase [Anaerolineales bacterium]|jgi:UDP:flavonoid glycosyltransferase YjiC (YdhE family)
MRIVIIALGSRGDVLPYATLGAGLKGAGHRVTFITSEDFTSLIRSKGLEMIAIPGDAQSILATSGANLLAIVRSFRDMSAGYLERSGELLPPLAEADLILNQLPGGVFGVDIAERYGIPHWGVAVIPLVRTSTFPMVGSPTTFSRLPGYNKMTYWLAEQMAWGLLYPLVNRWRVDILGLPRLPFSALSAHARTHTSKVLLGVSPHVVLPPRDWGDTVHVTGYWFPPEQDWKPPDDLANFIAAGDAPVFVGFGSMPVEHPEKTTQIILEAVRKAGQRLVLHAGWGELGEVPLPDNAIKVDYVPYDWLFPRMSAIVHHGGSGTTAAGLRAGVPSIVVPFLFDQRLWGNRVADLGAGPKPIPFRSLSAEKLTHAIQETVHNPEMKARAAELGAKIRSEDGLGVALGLIEDSFMGRELD